MKLDCKLLSAKFILMASIFSTVVACANSPQAVRRDTYLQRAEAAISKEKWDIAYRFLEDDFSSTDSTKKEKSVSLFHSNMSIWSAALQTFSVESISNTLRVHGIEEGIAIEKKRIDNYAIVAPLLQLEVARNNFQHVADLHKVKIREKENLRLSRAKEKSSVIDPAATTSAASAAERNRIATKKQIADEAELARITTARQVEELKRKEELASSANASAGQTGRFSLDASKIKCTELGFKPATEGYGKCVLQLSK
jgi:hypothetical protein